MIVRTTIQTKQLTCIASILNVFSARATANKTNCQHCTAPRFFLGAHGDFLISRLTFEPVPMPGTGGNNIFKCKTLVEVLRAHYLAIKDYNEVRLKSL